MSVLALVALVYLFVGFSWFMLNALIYRKRKLWWFVLALVMYTYAWPAIFLESLRDYKRLQQMLKPFNKWTFVFTGQRKFKN
jgi:hypothetical protein